MVETNSTDARVVIAHTLYPNGNSEGLLGFAKPIAEVVDDHPVEIKAETFCPTMKVFVTSGYDEMERRFSNHELFKLTVVVSERLSENVDPALACKYVSSYKRAEPLKPKELFEIIECDLPDADAREVAITKNIPGTRFIFIDNGESIYGPFKWLQKKESESMTLEFIDSPLPGVKLMSYQIYKIDRELLLSPASNATFAAGNRCFVHSLGFTSSAQFFDYASDDEILRFASKLAVDNNIKVIETAKFASLATQLARVPKLNVALVKQRLARLPQIVTGLSEVQSDVIATMGDYLKGEHGRAIVSTYVDSNKAHFLDGLRKEREAEITNLLAAQLEDVKNAEARVRELNDTKILLSLDVERLRKETKQEAALDTARAESDKQLQQKRQELHDVDREIAEKSAVLDALVDLETINARITKADDLNNHLVKREMQLRSTVADVQKELNSTEDDLRKKLTTMKPYVDAINGAYSADSAQPVEIIVRTHDLKPGDEMLVRQRSVVAEVKRSLGASGRVLEDWQIANLLISTQQSFLTFFAGLPGVGKTSLARMLPAAQGVTARLCEVAVARGWTSQKDLIGFYNPLSSRFQPAGTGMYGFLKAIDTEKKGVTQAMAYALLDEANLSPIEHYWSAFMGMADGEGSRTLLLGQDKVEIPSCLRFLATINYDGTTEPLSPRVIDRASIILIEPGDLSTPPADIGATMQALPVSASHMEELFGNDLRVPSLEAAEGTAFTRIRSTLLDSDPSLGRPLSISPRKELAIRQFCGAARGIMNAENELLAMDVAILQHVLPQVRGNGPRFAKRLEALRRDLEESSLSKSADFVARMLANGEIDLHTYDFFCW